ncbi:hypothetical protein [Streptomyces sp. NPDC001480]|uniref:hypothetical protein n=1 Tax=Streptomyces sp. NPDC001480 TaxID=3364577 RepID=UPI00367DAD89
MAVDQLPGKVREFANYLDGLLARLDQGGGWCGVFWQRDPEGMRACLGGREVPPWDVVDALLHDLAVTYGAPAAEAERERAGVLHMAALAAHDALPGARAELGDRLDVMLREQRYAAERQAELDRLLAAATTPEEADALRLDLAWAHDDHERATARCAELRSRMADLDRRATRGTPAVRRGADADVFPAGGGFPPGTDEAAPAGPHPARGAAPEAPARDHRTPARLPREAGDAPQIAAAGGSLREYRRRSRTPGSPGDAPGAAATAGATAPRPSGPAPGDARWATPPDPTADPTAFHPFRRPDRTPATDHEHPARPEPAATATTPSPAPSPSPVPAPAPHPTPEWAPAPEPSPATPKQRKRRRGSARFAGMTEEAAAPAVMPEVARAPAQPLAADPAPAPRRTPRGARFAGAAQEARRPEPRTEPAHVAYVEDTEAARPVAEAVERLVRLRAEGRSGEAHALLAEAAYWPASRFPPLAAELRRAGLGADWTTLLWEAASLPADRLVAAADALDAAGRSADGQQILRQGVARPAAEIAEAVLALDAQGRDREVRVLLDAYVRVRTPEEAARSVAADPRRLVPLLLQAARGVSQERHWDLLHAVRVAGFTA